jgi:hypothetical protein
MDAYQERQWTARAQLLAQTTDEASTRRDQLRDIVREAVREEPLVAVIAAEARQGNWRASAWLLSRLYPTKWGERGGDVPFALDDDADPFAEFDQVAERRRLREERKPPGY